MQIGSKTHRPHRIRSPILIRNTPRHRQCPFHHRDFVRRPHCVMKRQTPLPIANLRRLLAILHQKLHQGRIPRSDGHVKGSRPPGRLPLHRILIAQFPQRIHGRHYPHGIRPTHLGNGLSPLPPLFFRHPDGRIAERPHFPIGTKLHLRQRLLHRRESSALKAASLLGFHRLSGGLVPEQGYRLVSRRHVDRHVEHGRQEGVLATSLAEDVEFGEDGIVVFVGDGGGFAEFGKGEGEGVAEGGDEGPFGVDAGLEEFGLDGGFFGLGWGEGGG
mmetsp:Transcript_3547/g.6958  ORF Transcript_3547/g.6958 Transcript_3547/m.6958 type:complete len:273 (+) Transcript_3547:772-1590(+)